MPLWKAVAFVAGLGLSMLSYPVHAAPSSGGDTVQGLYDALLGTMKNAGHWAKRSFNATGAGYSAQLRHRLDGGWRSARPGLVWPRRSASR